MGSMFPNCYTLSSLNISNFDTSKVTDMSFMFSDCKELNSLNLSNFDTSNVINMKNMFSDCSKLEYINLKNFKENSSLSIENIFNRIQNNILVCLNENSSEILKEIMNKNCYTLDCSEDWMINQKKLVDKKAPKCSFINHNSAQGSTVTTEPALWAVTCGAYWH